MNYENLKSKIGPILIVLSCALLIFTVIYVHNKVKNSTPVDNGMEKLILREISIKDSIIAARMLERDVFLQYIDSLKDADTTIVNNKTNVIKQYYYETDRINALPDTGNIQLLSKNLDRLKERRSTGQLVLRR